MTRSFYTDTVTRLRAGTVTDHGDEYPDWSSPSSLTITGCRVQPLSSDEVQEDRDGVEIRHRLLGPSGIDVLPDDRIVYGSDTFEVWGAILSHRSPTGVAAHSEALLRRFDG